METDAPKVWRWYLGYSLGMAALTFVLTLVSIALLVFEVFPEEAAPALFANVFVCFPLIVVFGAVPFLPRQPWAWTYGVVVIALGLPCAVSIGFSLPLLIYWLRPEARAYFGRATT